MTDDGVIVYKNGGTGFVGPTGVNLCRMITLLSGLRLEAQGIKIRRGVNCFKIVKQEYGLKGRDKQRIIEQFTALVAEAKAAVSVTEG